MWHLLELICRDIDDKLIPTQPRVRPAVSLTKNIVELTETGHFQVLCEKKGGVATCASRETRECDW